MEIRLKKLNTITASILSAILIFSSSASAAEGTSEYIKSDNFQRNIDIASNTMNEFGDNILNIFTANSDQRKKPKKEKLKKEKLKEAKEKNSWDINDVVTMYDEGYSIDDISTAMKLSNKMDLKPFELLEKKGKPSYKAYDTTDGEPKLLDEDWLKEKKSKQDKKIQTFSDDTYTEPQPQYKHKKEEKSWETTIAELEGDEVATNEDMQLIKEAGLIDFIDQSVFNEEELSYLTEESSAESYSIALMSDDSGIDDTVTDAYNNIIFPTSRYAQFNAGTSSLSSDEDINVNPLTGNAIISATDISLKGRNGLDLNLTRINSGTNIGNVTPMLMKIPSTIISQSKTFYSIVGHADVTITYNEPLANGSYTQTLQSEQVVLKPYIRKSECYVASRSALLHDRELLQNSIMPIYMFDSYSAAFDAQTTALDGFYDRTYTFNNNTKIKSIEFEMMKDASIIAIKNEGTHTVYTNSEGSSTYFTSYYPYTATEKYFDIGIGWEFDFPYIERLYTNTSNLDNNTDYLHFGSKGVWKINDDYTLEDYYLNDLSVSSGGIFNGQNCLVTVTEKDGKKYYFGNYGQLYGIEDRFGNSIKFEYNTKLADGHYYPYQLTKITDTVGREITFDYSNVLQTVVTVIDKNDSTQNRVIKYNKTLMDSNYGDYVLSSVVGSENNETSYIYRREECNVSLNAKSFDDDLYGAITYYPVEYITKPSGLKIGIVTHPILGNCGTDGIAYRFETTQCKYQEPKNTELTKFTTYLTKKFTTASPVAYDGYPMFRSVEEIPAEIDIRTRISEAYWLSETKYVTNEYTRSENDNWICATTSVHTEGEPTGDDYTWRERTEYVYNDKEQCVKETHKKYNSPDNYDTYQSVVTEYTYDTAGYNDILKIKRFGSDEYSVNYQYDNKYHLPVKKTFKQDADTTVIENYTLTDDKKSVSQIQVTENNSTKRKREYSYDSYGNVISEKRYTGENNWNDYISIDYSYDDLSNNSNKINGANLSKVYVSGVKDIDGNFADGDDGIIEYQYTYDWFSNILTETDTNGNVFAYTYDKLNRPILLTNPDNGTISVSYGVGALNNYVQVTNENGNTMKYTYMSVGNIKEEKDVTANKVLKSYNYTYNDETWHSKTTVTNYSDYGNTTTATIIADAFERPVKVETTDSSGNVIYSEEYVYEQAVNSLYDCVTKTVNGETDDKDYTTKQYTDQFGNLVKEEVTNGSQTLTTEYSYDYVGNLLSVKSPRAVSEGWTDNVYTTQYEYDIDGQVTKTTDIYGNFITNEYDGLGRLVRSADAEATASASPSYSTYVYDALGRLLEAQTPIDNASYTQSRYYYDNNGNVTKAMVKNGTHNSDYSVTETSYNWRNNPVRVLTDGTDSAYYYDSVGNVLRMYTGELADFVISGLDNVSGADYKVTSYTYDTQNRVLTATDALGKTESNVYDITGSLVRTTDRNGNIINFVYDGMGNLTEQYTGTDSAKENLYTYTYNRMSLPLSVTYGGVTTTYTYDNLGQILKEELTTGIVKEYNYDSNGNRTHFKLTKDNAVQMNTTYTYDKLDRLQTVTNGSNASSYTYDRNGRLLTDITDGYTTTYTYNAGGWITGLATQKDGATIQNHSYEYYLDGNISQKQSTVGAQTQQYSYQYDKAGRLTQEQLGDTTTSYTYDAFGNRATMVSGDVSTSYTYDGNNRLLKEIKSKSGIDYQRNYTYDDNGNNISWYTNTISPQGGTEEYVITTETDGTQYGIYSYDAYNRVTSYTNGVTNASYTYDANNLRQSKTVDGITTNHIWDGTDIVMDVTGETANTYYRGAIGIAYANLNGTLSYYHTDAHGDVTALTDASGTIRQNYQFDAFGNQQSENANTINPFRYCGEYQDLCSGLIYLRNRYYDPNIGRFISEDPIKSGANWYVYANNNPVNYIDPLGLDAVLITADHAALWQGHTSIITQDTRNGNWYYFYWGDKATYFVEVPWEDGAMGSLDNFNSWLNNQDLPYSTKNYTSATFVEGDFNASVDYFKDLVAGTTIEKGYRMEAGRYDKPTMEYYQINKSYSLLKANCLQMSMRGFYKGTLKNGTSVNSFMNGQLDKTWMADTIPNFAEDVFNQLFFNRRFTRSDAKNDVTWEALYGSPGERYKTKGLFYAKTLGVSK